MKGVGAGVQRKIFIGPIFSFSTTVTDELRVCTECTTSFRPRFQASNRQLRNAIGPIFCAFSPSHLQNSRTIREHTRFAHPYRFILRKRPTYGDTEAVCNKSIKDTSRRSNKG